MKEIFIGLATAFLGTLGFSLVFQVRRKLLFWTSLGGLISWGVNLLIAHFTPSLFVPYMIASITAALYAEIFARIKKVPATLFLILALIPSIPGGSLFYTMSNMVAKQWPEALQYGKNTLEYALAIAVGISIVWAVDQIVYRIRKHFKKKKSL